MIGLVYPGINRLDYDFAANGGVFPAHIERLNRERPARWLEKVLHLLPIAPRPDGYSPLGEQHLDAKWVARLGQSGKDCFAAIRGMDVDALGASLATSAWPAGSICCRMWFVIRSIQHDLKAILKAYQKQYPGAMFSGCCGGYLIVASKKRVPGSLQVTVRVTAED